MEICNIHSPKLNISRVYWFRNKIWLPSLMVRRTLSLAILSISIFFVILIEARVGKMRGGSVCLHQTLQLMITNTCIQPNHFWKQIWLAGKTMYMPLWYNLRTHAKWNFLKVKKCWKYSLLLTIIIYARNICEPVHLL